MITGRFIDGTEDLSESYAIRREVFVEEQGVPETEEFDSYDEEAVHVVAFDGDKAVATARLAVVDDHYKLQGGAR